jgi:hypothetical protein
MNKEFKMPWDDDDRSVFGRMQGKNMRGWDPPSENDMDDNGMSRYMENNDEEGWN